MTLLHSTNSYYWNTYFKKLPIDEYKDTSLKRTLTQLEMMQQIAAVNESENKKVFFFFLNYQRIQQKFDCSLSKVWLKCY